LKVDVRKEVADVPVPPLSFILAAVLAGSLALAPTAVGAGSGTHARTAPPACPGSELIPTADDLGAVRAAIVCLHNQIRTRHHLPPLVENATLRRAALAHTANMVSHRYFNHTEPSGTTLVDRLLGASYIRRNQAWMVGENLGWATGSDATPAGIMREWMASPGHRTNILRTGYRDVGVGTSIGTPSDTKVGATYTADFGMHR
jgi:uncharacterized protein YkwD